MATRHNSHIKCSQVNLQHSRAATHNLLQLMFTEKTEITFVQEPYLYQNKPKGITSGYRTYTHGEGKSRAAIIISNDTINAFFITQFSDNDTVLLEIHKGHVYMDYKESIVNNLQTLEKILEFTEGAKLTMAMGSNARSTIWHDATTNNRGKMLEEFVASNQPHIINEDSPRRTFQSTRGSSNIYLTIVSNSILADIKDWEISEEESASNHNILKYIIKFENDKTKKQTTCKETCKNLNKPKSKVKGRSVPWWTDALKIMGKRTNALRRLYQKTKNNNDLRESRKNQYTVAKTAYQAAIRKEKTNSWKQHCTSPSPTNPWNVVYKLASGKTRNKATITTL